VPNTSRSSSSTSRPCWFSSAWNQFVFYVHDPFILANALNFKGVCESKFDYHLRQPKNFYLSQCRCQARTSVVHVELLPLSREQQYIACFFHWKALKLLYHEVAIDVYQPTSSGSSPCTSIPTVRASATACRSCWRRAFDLSCSRWARWISLSSFG
jgi:hypothetical protein